MPRTSAMYTKMSAEYNILWFVVDMYHRERYFFICGPKQNVVKSGLRSRPGVRWGKEEFTAVSRSDSGSLPEIYYAPSHAELTPAE
jgi:hypothetical protein